MPDIYKKEIKAIVSAGYYPNISEVVKDAIRLLFDSRVQLRMAAAVELYKDGEITLNRAAELAGVTTSNFKDVLKDRGVRIISPEKDKKEMGEQIVKIGEIRNKR